MTVSNDATSNIDKKDLDGWNVVTSSKQESDIVRRILILKRLLKEKLWKTFIQEKQN